MSDPTIKRIVEVFTEEVKTEIPTELSIIAKNIRASLKHLNAHALAVLVWDLLPTRKRPAISTVEQIIVALSNVGQHTEEPP